MRLVWVVVLLPVFAASSHAQADLDAVAAHALQEFRVPGMAVGVIEDGHVIVSKGYGVREQGASFPVTDKTLFGIASNTKAFTSAALAMLVETRRSAGTSA